MNKMQGFGAEARKQMIEEMQSKAAKTKIARPVDDTIGQSLVIVITNTGSPNPIIKRAKGLLKYLGIVHFQCDYIGVCPPGWQPNLPESDESTAPE